MTTVNLKLAELRKRNHLTQQELGEALDISHKNISKWENGVTMPDITLLPKLSEFFQVSVDELLGLLPLSEEYLPAQTGNKEYWADKTDYLMHSRQTLWNPNYMQFLIEKVWNIHQPVSVLDCGCGYGYLGTLLLPLLPQGSTYTGMDFSKEMLETGKTIFKQNGLKGKFIYDDFLSVTPSKSYDLVITQAALRHVDAAKHFLKKMIAFGKNNARIVCMEVNREFEEDGLYIEGMDYAELCKHDGFQTLWKTELHKQGRDYAIAMKLPHLMKQYGLKNVDVRLNDRVTYLEPEQADYEENFSAIIHAEDWTEPKTTEQCEELITYFMNHGMTRKDALSYCEKNNRITEFIKESHQKIALTHCRGLMLSYGWI